MKRRHLLGSVAALAILPNAGHAGAFPDHPLRFVVPYAPGGATDTSARIAAERLTELLGQQVIVDNRPGGGTIIGTEIVAKAKPDGYTILLAPGTIATNTAFDIKLPYDTVKDLVPVVGLVDMPILLAASNDAPFKTVAELIAWAKTQPGSISFSSAGNGSIPHLWGEQFGAVTGVKLEHIGYKGSADALKDVMGGQVKLFSDVLLPSGLQVKAGRLRGLAVATKERSPMLPDVPTVAEAGLPGMEGGVFFGIMTTTGTPPDVLARLNKAFNEILAEPATRKKLLDLGFILVGGSADAYGARVASETARWRKVIQDAHIPSPG
jgi:tripartite-type tricarboxylate transporter receptor subunit TctC